MKFKKVLLSLAAMAMVGFLSMGVSKAYAYQFGVVSGAISDTGVPVEGADVSVSCNGFNMNTMSNASGIYFVQFLDSECPVGQVVNVNASKGSMAGTNTGVMEEGDPFGGVVVDVAVVNVPLMPEFGLVTGALTSLVSGGLYLLKKRA